MRGALEAVLRLSEPRRVHRDGGSRRPLPRRVEIDASGQLVTRGQRLSHDERPVRALEVVVQVGPADAHVVHLETHVIRAGLGHGHVADHDVLPGLDEGDAHGSSLSVVTAPTTTDMPPSTKMFCPETKLD